MTTQFQLRRGTAAQTATFTGAIGEVTVDTTSNVLILHDSVTAGGNPAVMANAVQTVYNKTLSNTRIIGTFTSNVLSANIFTYANGVNILSGVAGTYADANVAAYLPHYSGTLGGDITIGGNLVVIGNLIAVNRETVNSIEIVAGNLVANSGVDSTSTSTGAVVAVGGVGISGNLNVGGTLGQTITIPASANQIYVAKNGSDANNGTLNQPFLTIKAALAAATAGTSVQIAPGTYTENNPIRIPDNVSLMGDNLRSVSVVPQNPNSDLFYTGGGCYVWGITIKNYNANGFAYSSTQSANTYYVSPYIQNITSSTTYPGATAVMIDGNYTSSTSTKAMIVGFFTIINQAGVGVHITNSGYSQLVNIYTIGANVGIWSETGGFCTLNGSDNSIGNIGLRADGYGPLLSYGLTSGYSTAGTFKIQNPTTPPHVNQVMVINGDTTYYTIDTISKLDSVTYQVNILETYNANLAPGTNISFYQRSEVVASAHTFEYVGAGTNPATALPQYGGYPNANLNVVTTTGGRVTYTATDEKGNFYIGSNLVINQATGTISGDSFSKSMFSLMTPYILALSEGP